MAERKKNTNDWVFDPGKINPAEPKQTDNTESTRPRQRREKSEKGNPLAILFCMVVLLVVFSIMPWAKWTGNKVKDFNLVEDLFPSSEIAVTEEVIDPELLMALEDEYRTEPEQPVKKEINQTASTDNVGDEGQSPDSESDIEPVYNEVTAKSSRINGMMVLEDYTPEGGRGGISRLKEIFASASNRPVRIAVIGDSYIEGDIFTQDIRRLLQDEYGGNGVGYMAMHSEFPGFRRSVTQTSSGWRNVDIRKSKSDTLRPLAGEYYVANAGAKSSFTGVKKMAHADSWDKAVFAYQSPVAGKLTFKKDGKEPFDVEVMPSEDIKFVTVSGPMSKVEVNVDAPGLKALGMWLIPERGISVDCMSLRGNSGLSHRNLSRETARKLSLEIPYDIIILEYGINALSSAQKDYTNYSNLMVKVVNEIRRVYPGAEILMLGIGDRGQKSGSAVKSLPTAKAMVNAQRKTAMTAGILFFDTREAMGGEDAIVEWRNKGYVNADYIHLNHKGGGELAKIFVDALNRSIK